MKKTLNIFLSIFMVVAIAASFTGCGGEDPVPPVVSVTPSSVDGWRADTVTFEITMSTNEKLAELKITPDVDDANQGVLTEDFSGPTSASYTYNYVIPGTVSDGDYITVSIKVTDNQGEITTKSVTINVVEPAASGTTLAYENTAGVLWSLIAPAGYYGAFDLAHNEGLSSSVGDTEKDMKNNSTSGWSPQWISGNATTYVKANTFDYAAGTHEDAATAFTSGTAATFPITPAVNDIYIAKLRAGSNYAVIKITNIYDSPSDNLDKIEFTYKKVAENSGQ